MWNHPTGDGQTALMSVARTGNVEAATLLIKRGAKVNAAREHSAARRR